jgi:hypothetical protein
MDAVERLARHPLEGASTETGGRVGYRGHPGSYGNLKNATFGEKLDTAIDNEGDVDASEADIE